MEIVKVNTVTVKEKSEEFEVLGVREGMSYLTNDRIIEEWRVAGIYEKLEYLTKVENKWK